MRGSVVLSNTISATARPMQIPDYSGQALRLSAGKMSGAITTPKLPTPPKVDAAELPIGHWATETTFAAPSKIRLAAPWPLWIPGAA